MNQRGYCIFIDTLCRGAVPSVTELVEVDQNVEGQRISVFPSEREAQHEIVDWMMTRLQQFLDGEREFEDAITVDEYVVEVEVTVDGKIVEVDRNRFG